MINLPKNWEDMIQVREYQTPVNQYGKIGFILILLKNEHNQVWYYEQEVKLAANDKDNATQNFEDAYADFCYRVPAIAANQDWVCAIKAGKEVYEKLLDNNWVNLPSVNPPLKSYPEYLKELEEQNA